jgi:hypothetical protein
MGRGYEPRKVALECPQCGHSALVQPEVALSQPVCRECQQRGRQVGMRRLSEGRPMERPLASRSLPRR